jgi:D-glycero-alpha-D-manno-heptose-7-phosphate kinase
MFEIQIKSPTRVDLAGGTLDFWPLYLFLNDPVTVNVAIDIFTYVDLKELAGTEVEIESRDMKVKKKYASLKEALLDNEPAFELVRAHLQYWQPQRGFSLSTRSESPIGGGLGGSSSLCISLLKAFSSWLKKSIEPDAMVRLASHLEARVLLKPTGTQDYFPPIFGGLNLITYGAAGPTVEVKPVDQSIFDERFLLVYTGHSHNSGINNWQVIKNWLDGDEKTRSIFSQLADVSAGMKEALLAKDLSRLPALFAREYEARTAISSGFSSPEIRRLADLARESGAYAKICGAGGGGCVLIWCPDRQKNEVAQKCRDAGFEVLNASPWEGR